MIPRNVRDLAAAQNCPACGSEKIEYEYEVMWYILTFECRDCSHRWEFAVNI